MTISETITHSVEMHRNVPGPPERVWQALVEPSQAATRANKPPNRQWRQRRSYATDGRPTPTVSQMPARGGAASLPRNSVEDRVRG